MLFAKSGSHARRGLWIRAAGLMWVTVLMAAGCSAGGDAAHLVYAGSSEVATDALAVARLPEPNAVWESATPAGATVGESAQTTTERMAIPVLQAAGGRSVHVAEDPHGSLISVIALVSSLGDGVVVTVGPEDQLDPMSHLPAGEVFDEDIGKAVVRLVDPADRFPASGAGFTCNGYGWSVELAIGDITDTRAFIAGLIEAIDCGQILSTETSPPELLVAG